MFWEHRDKTVVGKYSHEGRYEVVSMFARMKHPDTGEWFSAVIYTDCDNAEKLYVRERRDFLNKFKRVKDES